MSRKRFSTVAVLMGGPSREVDVSLNSGAAVARGLRSSGYNVHEVLVRGREFFIPTDVEAAFIAVHGTFGEDGELQSLLEAMRLPYTGTGPLGSRQAMNKIEAKLIMSKAGIPSPASEVLRRGQPRSLALPVVVKPPREGSSFGISRVTAESGWQPALEKALSFDDEVLVETYIGGRELTAGVLAGSDGPEALPLVEIIAPDGEYDFTAKYTKGRTRYDVPACLNETVTACCKELGVRMFAAFGGCSMGRTDIRLNDEGNPYVLELNTIPGFTETSLLPKAAAAAGIPFDALCRRIMETASLKECDG